VTQVTYKNAKSMKGRHYPNLRRLVDDLRPPRYIAFCSSIESDFYHLAIQVAYTEEVLSLVILPSK